MVVEISGVFENSVLVKCRVYVMKWSIGESTVREKTNIL